MEKVSFGGNKHNQLIFWEMVNIGEDNVAFYNAKGGQSGDLESLVKKKEKPVKDLEGNISELSQKEEPQRP